MRRRRADEAGWAIIVGPRTVVSPGTAIGWMPIAWRSAPAIVVPAPPGQNQRRQPRHRRYGGRVNGAVDDCHGLDGNHGRVKRHGRAGFFVRHPDPIFHRRNRRVRDVVGQKRRQGRRGDCQRRGGGFHGGGDVGEQDAGNREFRVFRLVGMKNGRPYAFIRLVGERFQRHGRDLSRADDYRQFPRVGGGKTVFVGRQLEKNKRSGRYFRHGRGGEGRKSRSENGGRDQLKTMGTSVGQEMEAGIGTVGDGESAFAFVKGRRRRDHPERRPGVVFVRLQGGRRRREEKRRQQDGKREADTHGQTLRGAIRKPSRRGNPWERWLPLSLRACLKNASRRRGRRQNGRTLAEKRAYARFSAAVSPIFPCPRRRSAFFNHALSIRHPALGCRWVFG